MPQYRIGGRAKAGPWLLWLLARVGYVSPFQEARSPRAALALPLTLTLTLTHTPHPHHSPLTTHHSPLTTHHSPLNLHPNPNQAAATRKLLLSNAKAKQVLGLAPRPLRETVRAMAQSMI